MNQAKWEPNSEPQRQYFASRAFELLVGGAGGGGKTDMLLMDGLRQVKKRGYNGIIFRRTFRELEMADAIIPRAHEWYPLRGGEWSEKKTLWTFPKGSFVYFSHMQNKNDHLIYQGAQFQYIAFDELGSFEEHQYTYLFSRCRTKYPEIKCYVRNSANPGTKWVKKRWGPWVDKKHPQYPTEYGKLLYFALNEATGKEEEVERGTPNAWSRSFIPASWRDNPNLDPGYETKLNMLPLVQRRQIKDGDWEIEEGSGTIIKQEWFFEKVVKAFPAGAKLYRGWDLAATKKSRSKKDPDYTATCLACMHEGRFYIQLEQAQISWADVKRWITSKAISDGEEVGIGIEQEGGASGKGTAEDLVEMLQGRHVEALSASGQGDKVARSLLWTSQAEVGNVYIVETPLTDTDEILKHFYDFPEGDHDDMVDAVSIVYKMCLKWSGTSLEERYGSKKASYQPDDGRAGSLKGRFSL